MLQPFTTTRFLEANPKIVYSEGLVVKRDWIQLSHRGMIQYKYRNKEKGG